jgi:dethiobiotin synthetase
MNKGVFITGTGTGAGKTYISCKIARGLRANGINVGVFKPVATGDRNDAKKLISAAGTGEPLENVNPVFFKHPLAPLVSARLSKNNIEPAAILNAYKELKKQHNFIIVEGAGGIYVPLTNNYYVFNMIQDFSLPAIIVARSYLGSINHTLLTVEKLRSEKIIIAGIIMNYVSKKTDTDKTNSGIIRELTGLPVAVVGRGGNINLEKNKWITG